MSAIILEKIQTRPFADSDSTCYIRAVISCDTAADLPAANYFSGYTLEQASKAHVIADNQWYMLQSSGTWVQQLPEEIGYTYTKAEIDSMVSDVQDAADDAQNAADAAQAASDTNKSYIGVLAAQAGKNRLTADQTTQTIDTATITANGDGTYHIETTAATTQQVVFTLGTAVLHTGIEYIITGIVNGSNTTYFLNYDKSSASGTGNQNVYAGGYQIATGETERLTTVKFYIRSGQELNVDIAPMIMEKQWYTGFPEFTPYQITLQDLYALVRSYHP